MSSEKLFVKCSVCRKEISKTAKICPYCGEKYKKISVIQWIGIVFAVLFFIGLFSDPDDTTSSRVSEPIVEAISKSQIEINIPIDQEQFNNTIEKYIDRFSGMKNELQQSLLRDQRKQDISKSINSMRVQSWIGTINQLSTNSEGKAILSVKISPDISIKTWNNALSDIMTDTLIEKGTSVYKTLLPLSIGRKVKFSGSFFPSEADYIQETSVTIRGSISSPEFLFKFHSIELVELN